MSLQQPHESRKISVYIRMRPLNQRELDAGSTMVWNIEGNSLEVQSDYSRIRGSLQSSLCFGIINEMMKVIYILFLFVADNVFGPQMSSNLDIYSTVANDLIINAIQGINGICNFSCFHFNSVKEPFLHMVKRQPVKHLHSLVTIQILELLSMPCVASLH